MIIFVVLELVVLMVVVALMVVVVLVVVVVLMSTKEAMRRSTCPPGVTYGNPKHSPTTQQT